MYLVVAFYGGRLKVIGRYWPLARAEHDAARMRAQGIDDRAIHEGDFAFQEPRAPARRAETD
jgi:hypothetical protein